MPNKETDCDVVIIGGGPSGMSAAAWCSELGLRSILFDEREELGGQLLNIYNRIENYPGVSANSGKEFRDRFLGSIAIHSFERRMGSRVTAIDVHLKMVTLESGEVIVGRALIIATGVRRRKLGVEGEDEFLGRGILESGAKEAKSVAGKTVMVIGGGDAAIENALMLAQFASKVIVVHRRTQFTARTEFHERAQGDPKIEFVTDAVIGRFVGNRNLTGVDLQNKGDNSIRHIAIDAALIRIGFVPNSELVQGALETDEQGYIAVDRTCETNVNGIFAIGDVSNPASPTISSAAGDGPAAAKAVILSLAGHGSVTIVLPKF